MVERGIRNVVIVGGGTALHAAWPTMRIKPPVAAPALSGAPARERA
jgi:hypothetical protein